MNKKPSGRRSRRSHQWHLEKPIKSSGWKSALLPLNCFLGLKTRMGAGFLCMNHLTLPSYLPSKNKRLAWRGRCTRFARRLLFHINRQLST